jgi:hypothetical protein
VAENNSGAYKASQASWFLYLSGRRMIEMYFAGLQEIAEAAKKAAERDGIPFYIVCNPSRKQKKYTALPSTGFGLPEGFFIERMVMPENERVELDPPEKTSANGF